MLALRTIKILPPTSRGLNNVVSKNFGVFTNETLKKGFDERLKEKYSIRDNEQAQQEEAERKGIYEEMKAGYEEVFNTLEKEESILKTYKNQLTIDEGNVLLQQKNVQDALFAVEADNHFKGVSTSEYMKRSRNLINSIKTNQTWAPIQQDRISDEYLNYEKYEKNYSKFRDVIKNPEESSEQFSTGKNVLNYIKKLDKNVTEHQAINHIIDTIGEKEEDPVRVQKELEDYWNANGVEGDCKPDAETVMKTKINFGEPDKEEQLVVYGRLSPHAREEIYKLHNEGWSIRDISIRFGILPERAKAVIWARQYFYDEIMPNTDISTVQLALEREMLYSMNYPWVDYGLDLEQLAVREQGVQFRRYRTTELDARPPKEVEKKMESVLETKAKKKYDIVTENFVGRSDGGFYIKNWMVYKGHGSERVNMKFKMAIQQQDMPQLMPDKVRGKLKKGPRKASLGYGVK